MLTFRKIGGRAHINLLQPIFKVPALFPQWLTPVFHVPLIIIAYWVGIVFLLAIAICFLDGLNQSPL